ncbi:MAG: hypothetical protein K9G76_08215 [Bacteroidales bacterium]|nr:hypothetical protein [Bacteroidales bacterium]
MDIIKLKRALFSPPGRDAFRAERVLLNLIEFIKTFNVWKTPHLSPLIRGDGVSIIIYTFPL